LNKWQLATYVLLLLYFAFKFLAFDLSGHNHGWDSRSAWLHLGMGSGIFAIITLAARLNRLTRRIYLGKNAIVLLGTVFVAGWLVWIVRLKDVKQAIEMIGEPLPLVGAGVLVCLALSPLFFLGISSLLVLLRWREYLVYPQKRWGDQKHHGMADSD
jgi:hypothetical protein